MLGSLQAVMPLSTDLDLPGLMIGVALGQVASGPITDKWGRKKPPTCGLAVFLLGAGLCALAPGLAVLMAGHFLQALGASASAVIPTAIVRDLWSGKALADRLSLLVLVMGVAPPLSSRHR